jgi:hypothetical protein
MFLYILNCVSPGVTHGPTLTAFDQDVLFSFLVLVVGGGTVDGHGEGKAGTGVHESKAVLHPAVSGREGDSFDQSSGGEKETLGGSFGDEVSVYDIFLQAHAWLKCFSLWLTPNIGSLIVLLDCISLSRTNFVKCSTNPDPTGFLLLFHQILNYVSVSNYISGISKFFWKV